MFVAELEGVDELEAAVESAEQHLRDKLARGSLTAAEAGVKEAQAEHPYTDRTYQLTETARAVADGDEATMVWPKEYAGFVDKGTSRSRPYPFTPIAEARAEAALDRATEDAIEEFETTLSR